MCDENLFLMILFLGLIARVSEIAIPKKWITDSKTGELVRVKKYSHVKWAWLNYWGKTLRVTFYSSLPLALLILYTVDFYKNSGAC